MVLTPNGAERIDVAFADGCIVALGDLQGTWSASRSGWTLYDGMVVTGWPIHTVIRGQVVARDEQLMGLPQGRTIRFLQIPAETSGAV